MKELFMNIVLSGTGAAFVLLFLTRLLPNDKLKAAFLSIGRFLTGYGRSRLGKTFWEKIDDFIENSITACWEGFREGLNVDEKEQQ